jgi:hypothetical protein
MVAVIGVEDLAEGKETEFKTDSRNRGWQAMSALPEAATGACRAGPVADVRGS